MAKDVKGGRNQAEEQFNRAQKTTKEAMSIIDTEREARRSKTARLRALRLAKEGEERAAAVVKKPAAKKPAAKKKAVKKAK